MAARQEGLRPIPKPRNNNPQQTSKPNLPKQKQNKPNTRVSYQHQEATEIWNNSESIAEKITKNQLQDIIQYRLSCRVSCPLPDNLDTTDHKLLVQQVIFSIHRQLGKMGYKSNKMEFHSKFEKVYVYLNSPEEAQKLDGVGVELFHKTFRFKSDVKKPKQVVVISANISHIIPWTPVEEALAEYGAVESWQCVFSAVDPDDPEIYSDLYQFRVTLDEEYTPQHLPPFVTVGEKQ